jgi:hypothetical protein
MFVKVEVVQGGSTCFKARILRFLSFHFRFVVGYRELDVQWLEHGIWTIPGARDPELKHIIVWLRLAARVKVSKWLLNCCVGLLKKWAWSMLRFKTSPNFMMITGNELNECNPAICALTTPQILQLPNSMVEALVRSSVLS